MIRAPRLILPAITAAAACALTVVSPATATGSGDGQLVTPAPTSAGEPAVQALQFFPDVPLSHSFYDEIMWLSDNEISRGYDDGTFRTTAPVTRQAMAAFMYRLVGEPEIDLPETARFLDVPVDHAFRTEIEWLAFAEISTGYDDGTFRPNAPVSRQAMAAFMYRLAGEPTPTGPMKPTLRDVVAPSAGAAGSAFYFEIRWLAENGISAGYADRTFRPSATVSRQAMAAFMQRMSRWLDPVWGTSFATVCNDGIDNDGDGWGDWMFDLGCYGPEDTSEAAGPREAKGGWTTYDKPSGNVYYVSSSQGKDTNDGLSPATPFETLDKAFSQYRRGDKKNDYVLLLRGDTFRPTSQNATLNWSRWGGKSADEPFVIATYGPSRERATIELSKGYTILTDASGYASHRAFHGLDFYWPHNDPNHPSFIPPTSPTWDPDNHSTGLSFYGLGENLLFEDVRLRYGNLNIQGAANSEPAYLSDVTIRRSVIANAWSPRCGAGGHSQGSFFSNLLGLTIEETLYHHNGWNEEYGCATMFNHNVYAARVSDVTITDSAFLHGSSMGIKFSAFAASDEDPNEPPPLRPGTMDSIHVENNLLAFSEIGISFGGNGNGLDRFSNSVVRGNVFSELGADNSTNRNFNWAIDLLDHQHLVLEDNYFVDQPWNTNTYGIKVGRAPGQNGGQSNSDVMIRNNVFYDFTRKHIEVADGPLQTDISIQDNIVVQGPNAAKVLDARDSYLVNTVGGGVPAGVTFSGNQYSAQHDGWFYVDRVKHDLTWWKQNHEPDASEFEGSFADPGRTMARYATTLGLANRQELEAAMVSNSRLRWRPQLTPAAVTEYIKAGYQTQ